MKKNIKDMQSELRGIRKRIREKAERIKESKLKKIA